MKKTDFEALDIEKRYNIVKTHLDYMYSVTSSRIGMLPQTAALAATLLAVATFNDKLLSLTDLVRYLITVLLAIIPMALILYNHDLINAETGHRTTLEQLLGNDISAGLKKTATGWFIGAFPAIGNGIVLGVVVLLIYAIWNTSS